MSNFSPSQEPVAWYGALGILLNAILVAVFVLAPEHGLTLTAPDQGALEGIVNGVYLLVGAIVTRQNVTPTALPPVPAPAPPAVPS